MLSHRLSNPEPGISATELLEASKKLYVKTAILRHTRLAPDKPRLFVSSSQEEQEILPSIMRPPVCFAPLPSAYNPLSSPSGSAFKRVSLRSPTQPPPLPPKSDFVRERSKRHTSLHHIGSLPDCSRLDHHQSEDHLNHQPSFHKKPIPKPRLSKMAPLNAELSTCVSIPVPTPRRKTTAVVQEDKPDFNNCQRFFSPLRTDGHMVTSRRNIAKSSPNLVADGRPITGIRRKILAAQGRSVTPLVQINQEPKMDQYAEEKDFLAAAMHEIEFGDEDDLENEQPEMFMRFGRGNNYATTSFETPILVSASSPSYSPPAAPQSLSSNPLSPLMSPSSPNSAESGSKSTKALSTPTSKDSGHPSDGEDENKRQGTSKSEDDGFFDASGERRTDGDVSEGESIFTSVTNQPKREEDPSNEENRGKPISELERKARVMRWINEAAHATQI